MDITIVGLKHGLIWPWPTWWWWVTLENKTNYGTNAQIDLKLTNRWISKATDLEQRLKATDLEKGNQISTRKIEIRRQQTNAQSTGPWWLDEPQTHPPRTWLDDLIKWQMNSDDEQTTRMANKHKWRSYTNDKEQTANIFFYKTRHCWQS